MLIDSINVVIYSFIFLMPGFIIKSIIDAINPSVKESDFKSVLRLLLYSALNYGICFLLSLILFSQFIPAAIPVWGNTLIVVLAAPVIFGLFAGYAKRKDLIRNFLDKIGKKIGIKTINPIPAWDWKFSRTKDPWFIIVTLTDNSTIAGYFGNNSFASLTGVNRDLYIEKTFEVGDNINDEWKPTSNEGGILVTSDQVRSVEFVKKTV